MDQENTKPLVLVTNDDGFESPGIIELAAELSNDFELLFVAPKIHHSGTGRGVPFGPSYHGEGTIEKHTIEISPGTNITAYSVDGTPALSVVHAVLEIAPRLPDFCISGVNFGENTGKGLHYSGTIGAAMEAANFGIPSIAVSQQMDLEDIFAFEGYRSMFSQASKIVSAIAKKMLLNPLDLDFVCLNVNIPKGASIQTPVELANQGMQDRWVWKKPEMRDFSEPFQLYCENIDDPQWEEGTDNHTLLVKKHVSVTPLTYLMHAEQSAFKVIEEWI